MVRKKTATPASNTQLSTPSNHHISAQSLDRTDREERVEETRFSRRKRQKPSYKAQNSEQYQGKLENVVHKWLKLAIKCMTIWKSGQDDRGIKHILHTRDTRLAERKVWLVCSLKTAGSHLLLVTERPWGGISSQIISLFEGNHWSSTAC